MNSARWKVVLCGLAALLAAVVIIVLASGGRGGGGEATRPAATATRSISTPTHAPDPALASPRRGTSRASAHGRRPPHRPEGAGPWQSAARATARAFVTWFDRWLAGESTARQAPSVTRGYAARLRATVNNVPPGSRGQLAAIVSLIPAGMPPNVTRPREAWVYTATLSQGAVVRFTVEERLIAGRWLVYNVYQGP